MRKAGGRAHASIAFAGREAVEHRATAAASSQSSVVGPLAGMVIPCMHHSAATQKSYTYRNFLRIVFTEDHSTNPCLRDFH